LHAVLAVIAFTVLASWPAFLPAAAPAREFTVDGSGTRKVLHFTAGEISFAERDDIPAGGWQKRAVPSIWLSDEARARQNSALSAWLRLRFDSSDLGDGPIAIYTENNRERLSVFLNGTELFRNYKDSQSHTMGWNKPYILPLPKDLIHPGANTLVLKVVSDRQFYLGFGTVKVGSQDVLGAQYSHQYFWRITGVASANYAMLFMTFAVFLMWLARPKERQLLWLFATGAMWFVRDYHFFAEEIPFNPFLFQQITFYSLFFAVAFSLCFCAEFLQIRHHRRVIGAMLGFGIAISLARMAVEQSNRTDLLAALATMGMAMIVVGLVIAHWYRERTRESLVLMITLAATTLAGLHDAGRMPHVNWWEGIGFHIQPYTGFLLFCVFLLSLGRRLIEALAGVEDMNIVLEQRVQFATEALERSEKARQALAIEHAIGIERERLMREMHDGIGSNLVTALAVARHNDPAAPAVATLERAITDLKLTVDSLAPVDGDVVALLANLRHRMEPAMNSAGLRCVWDVLPCPPIEWLDATSALQMLRIIQEGISNVLVHAEATVITIGCRVSMRDGREGIAVSLKDNGRGLSEGHKAKGGRGMINMAARAEQLGAILDIASKEPGTERPGTALTLWLPLEKRTLETV